MPVPAGSPTWFITLAFCATTGFCQAQVAVMITEDGNENYSTLSSLLSERQGHIRTSRSTKTGSEAVGPAHIPAFGTKASGFSGGRPIINAGNKRQELPPLPGGTIAKNQKGAIARPESSPIRFPGGTSFRVPSSAVNVRGFRIKTNGSTKETFKRTNGARIRFAQRPDINAPGSENNVMRTDNVPGGFPDRLGFGLDKITNSIGAQILQEEAPMIREIETKMHEGREMERNLTAIRDAIRQEIVGARGIGIIRRIKMKRQLRELEFRIRELHGKNQEGESKFRAFVSGIASGEIRDRRSARSVLYTIFNFYGTIVSKIVTICRGFAGGIINIYKRIALGVGGVIHRLLALKLRPLEAGINIISGI
ncbi:hypothetical protein HPB51_005219 [Rhipicephalus microplus]|uniref:Secreted protein n=1 Tax=Rhipicephalus microplus TaxID=6941 RepID=A0A9J6E766_RHIMP|nr:hypothetical protein HPB51_005219 [Rhipicephalus microplus]